MTGITAAFGKPFRQQVAAFRLRLRNLVGTAAWDDLWQAEHDRAFMVAGAMKAELLADLAAAVDRSIAEGATLEDFRRDFRAIVQKNGWHGWTGKGTKKGEAWRTRVIYRTNLATSYAAGRWAQLMEGGFPFIVYSHGNSLEPRIQHLAWDGLVLPAEHPFWQTHAPPNGWGCSCYASGARTREGARRVGGDPGKELPDGWQAIDGRTGAPVGIDKGWAYAPGASVAVTVGAISNQTVRWPFELAKAYMAAVPAGYRDAFATGYRQLPSLGAAVEAFWRRVVGATEAPAVEYRTLGLATTRQADQVASLLSAPVDGFDWVVSDGSVRHIVKNHGDVAAEARRGQRAVTATDLARVGSIIDAPDAMVAYGTRLLVQKEIDGEIYELVFERLARRRMLRLVTMWIGRRPGT